MQPILQHLFKKNALQDIPAETLKQITLDFPYFSIGQYLLARKFQQNNEPAFEDQFQKTLVYFYNPLWLHYKLSEAFEDQKSESDVGEYAKKIEIVVPESIIDISTTPHDMIEDVILHPENNYSDSMPGIDSTVTPVEAHSPELVSANKETVTQTIQREDPFTFQAYYTVDYFASQGIKLGQDNQQQDKLGKQLKSFTEWLKTMRRLPETSVVEILDKINDSEIAKFASHSLDEKEVITEAMAEVFVKQGKKEKALDLYHKLSLQSPHKSTYFAAKIEDLKLY